MRYVALLLLLAGCAPAPAAPGTDEEREIRRLAEELDGPAMVRLSELGEPAVPALVAVLRGDPKPWRRVAAAKVLARIHGRTGLVFARTAWAAAVREAKPAHAASLLELAPGFADADGETLFLLNAGLATMAEVTPGMVRAAGRMGESESLEALTRLIGKTAALESSPARDEAIRYVGRAARRGRREAVEFLLSCATSGRRPIESSASAELALLAGRMTPPNWRAWWLDHAGGTRAQWIAEALALGQGGPLDLGDRAVVGRIVAAALDESDPEPEFHLLERLLGRDFGYVSPRDRFEDAPDAEPGRRAKETLKAWWAENERYLAYDAAAGRYVLDEKARAAGTPVPPK